MNWVTLSKQVMWAILITLLLGGCGSPTAAPTLIPSTETPPPTQEPSPEPIVEVGEVIFDGAECAVHFPTELPPGKYSIVFIDANESDAHMLIFRFDDGKTIQDALDLQNEPGDYVPEQDWLLGAIETGIAWSKPDGGEVHTYRFISEGEYVVGIWIWETPTTPFRTWFCTPFWVKEAPSE